MRVFVCGARNIGRTSPNATYRNAKAETQRATSEGLFVFDYLSSIHEEKSFTEVIGSDEGGAEELAIHWAQVNNIPQKLYFLTNNGQMIVDRNKRLFAETNPDLIISFGSSVYAEILIGAAKEKGIQVIEVAIPDFQ